TVMKRAIAPARALARSNRMPAAGRLTSTFHVQARKVQKLTHPGPARLRKSCPDHNLKGIESYISPYIFTLALETKWVVRYSSGLGSPRASRAGIPTGILRFLGWVCRSGSVAGVGVRFTTSINPQAPWQQRLLGRRCRTGLMRKEFAIRDFRFAIK